MGQGGEDHQTDGEVGASQSFRLLGTRIMLNKPLHLYTAAHSMANLSSSTTSEYILCELVWNNKNGATRGKRDEPGIRQNPEATAEVDVTEECEERGIFHLWGKGQS